MKPYYEHAGITIYHGDAREFLPRLEGGIILTDSPYGNGTEYASFSDTQGELKELALQVSGEFRRFERVAITPGVANVTLWPKPNWTLAWFTPAGAGSGPWGFCCWQPILVYGKDPYLQTCQGRRPDAIVWTETVESNGHPCPKPIGLWKWLLKRISPNDSETLIDPFCGSGTTLKAAKDFGRKAIGIEIEEKYCEIAAKRLSQEVFQF